VTQGISEKVDSIPRDLRSMSWVVRAGGLEGDESTLFKPVEEWLGEGSSKVRRSGRCGAHGRSMRIESSTGSAKSAIAAGDCPGKSSVKMTTTVPSMSMTRKVSIWPGA